MPVGAPARKSGGRHAQGSPKPRDYEPDAGWKPLSNTQKAALAILAKKAAKMMGEPESGPAHDDWRHDQAYKACGERIKFARQEHWQRLHSHFLDLSGHHKRAFEVATDDGNKKRIALYKLTGELGKRGLALSYAEKICLTQYRCDLAGATAQQVWRLVYTVRNSKHKPIKP
jgi:hypothetical protein